MKRHVAGRSRRVIERYRRALTDFPYLPLERLRRAVVVCHKHADIDAYCAAYGVAYLLRRLRKGLRVSVATPEGVSIPARRVSSKYPVRLTEKIGFEGINLVVVVDTGHLALLSHLVKPLVEAECTKVFLDHHPLSGSIKEIADHVILDESASSTSEIVYGIIAARDLPITRTVAQVLLTGIIADSKHLRLSTTRTVRIAAELCEKGASIGVATEILGAAKDRSERIARLKGAQRLALYRLDDWIIGVTEIGSYQASVARALIDLGVDFAVSVGKDGEESRCCLRATQSFHQDTGVHLGCDVAERTAGDLGGVGGGHPTAASFTGRADVDRVVKGVLEAVERATRLAVKRLK